MQLVRSFAVIIIFIQIENDADILWKADVREKNEDVAARGKQFMDWYIHRLFPILVKPIL